LFLALSLQGKAAFKELIAEPVRRGILQRFAEVKTADPSIVGVITAMTWGGNDVAHTHTHPRAVSFEELLTRYKEEAADADSEDETAAMTLGALEDAYQLVTKLGLQVEGVTQK
jgi:hypothetical protein